MTQMEWQLGGAVIIGLIAAVWDIKCRKIPNWLTFPAAAAGIIVNVALNLKDWPFPLLGMLVGLIVLIVPYIFGGIGAGDVKLLMALGAFLGVKGIVWVTLYGAVVGGILSLILIIRREGVKNGLYRIFFIGYALGNRGQRHKGNEEETKEKLYIPYAVAIFFGIICFMLVRVR